MAISVFEMRSRWTNQVCKASVITMENNFSKNGGVRQGMSIRYHPMGTLFRQKSKCPVIKCVHFVTQQKEVVKICQNGQVLIIEDRDHGIFNKITICCRRRCIG